MKSFKSKPVFLLTFCAATICLVSVMFLSSQTKLSARDESFGFVLKGLSSINTTSKSKSAEVLADIGDIASIPKIKLLLADKSDNVKLDAARALGKLGIKTGYRFW